PNSNTPTLQHSNTRILSLVLEKIPFFMLSAIGCVATVWAQAVAMQDSAVLPLRVRVANALASYILYLRKAFWPADLVFYAYWRETTVLQAVCAGLLLLAITAFVFWQVKRRFLLVGWFWFLGTLVPVIGLVQVGFQSLADRYTYIPLIGIFIML